MPFSLSNSWTEPAVRVAAAGVGFLVGGPLGGVLGGLHGAAFAGVLGASGEELARVCSEHLGNNAVKKMFGEKSGSLKNLEDLYRKALQQSLREVHSHLAPDFEDWFANWDMCLASTAALEISPIHPDQLIAEELDPIFQRTLEQLDAQGLALSRYSVSLKQETRTIPDVLLTKLAELLPEQFRKWFQNLVHKPEYEQAWKEKQQEFQENVKRLLSSIKSDTGQIRSDTGQILVGQGGLNEKLDELLRRTIASAERDERIDRAEARALSAEAEAEEWKRKFIELTKSNPSLDELLSSGDFEAAALKKTQQLEKQSSGLAQSYFELGTIHELRFDWQKALAAYREAWRLEPNLEYGRNYAWSARIQNQFSEALAVYEVLRGMCTMADDMAAILNNLARLYSVTQRVNEAEEAYLEALSIRRKLAEENPSVYLPVLANTLNNIAYRWRKMHRLKESQHAYLEALSIRRKLAQENPSVYLPVLAETLGDMAVLYGDAQTLKEAENSYLEALSIRRKLAQENPSVYLPVLAETLGDMAIPYGDAQMLKEAENSYLEALSIRRKLAQENPSRYLPGLAGMLNNAAILLRDTPRLNEAEDLCREALSIRRKLAQENPLCYLPDLADGLNEIGIVLSNMHRLNEAEDAHLEALFIHRKLAQEDPSIYLPDVAETLNYLVVLHRDTERTQEATAYCREAKIYIEPLWKANPEVHGDLMAKLLRNEALLCEPCGEAATRACDLARQAYAAAYDPVLKQDIQQLIGRLCVGHQTYM